MKNVLIKLRKGKNSFGWEDYISNDTEYLEIIAPSLLEIEDRFDEISHLKSLQIHCPMLENLPQSFYTLTNLETLKIKNNETINLNSIGSFKQLKNLQLAKLKLKELPIWMESSINVEMLDLHGNQLIDLPDYFKNYQKLKRLNLDSNSFTTLPWELEQLKSLNHLSIDNNSFNEEEKNRIQKVFNISF